MENRSRKSPQRGPFSPGGAERKKAEAGRSFPEKSAAVFRKFPNKKDTAESRRISADVLSVRLPVLHGFLHPLRDELSEKAVHGISRDQPGAA